jgi:hypothetical protein
LIDVAILGGVLLALAVSSYFLIRRNNQIHEEFAALADELDRSPEQTLHLVGKPTRVPTYIAPTNEVVLVDRRVRRVELHARVLSKTNSLKDRELSL